MVCALVKMEGYPRDHEQQLRAAVAAIPAEVRAFALAVATLPDEETHGADRRALPRRQLRSFTELKIDLEEEPAARIRGRLRRLSH